MSSILKVDTIQDASGNAIISSDGSGNLTPNTFTALTVSGDLTVDTDTLYVDSSNNEVGMGTTSPDARLHIQATAATSGQDLIKLSNGADAAELVIDTSANEINFKTGTGDDIVFLPAGTEALRINDSGNTTISGDLTVDTDTLYVDSTNNEVGVGTDSPSAKLDVYSTASDSDGILRVYQNTATSNPTMKILQRGEGGSLNTNQGLLIDIAGHNDGNAYILNTSVTNSNINGGVAINPFSVKNIGTFQFRQGGVINESGGDSDFRVESDSNTHALFVDGGNDAVLFGKSVYNSIGTVGVEIRADAGLGMFTRFAGNPIVVNRTTNDGALIDLRQDGTTEGIISVSGITVTYGGFTGSHWSRLSDNSKPKILKGTILESLDEMMDWYQVQFDITEIDDEGNETTRTQKESYALGDGESVGDVITYNYEGTDYQATIIQEEDIKHTKSKVSDTIDAKNVYGVFVAWDNDDDTVNDMNVAQTGSYVIRINGSETVSKGDLIQSNGDGTGKVQSDDIIRASTVAKVISSTKIETYDDGSYIVPCTLHC